MVRNHVVRVGSWNRRVFKEFEKCLAGERPAFFVFRIKGGRVRQSFCKRNDSSFAVHGPDEFLGGGENYVEIERDENAI